jgi:hypothetical protein
MAFRKVRSIPRRIQHSGEIVSFDLTMDDVGDPTALPGLLNQTDKAAALFLTGGACDEEPTSDLLAAEFESIV